MRILTGDIGGTHARLQLLELRGQTPQVTRTQTLASRDYADLPQLLSAFLQPQEGIDAAGLALAAPVVEGVAQTTNLPWPPVTQTQLETLLRAPVLLLNDLAATALGLLHAPRNELLTLQEGTVRPGPRAVIAPGTGLGQALVWQVPEKSEELHVQATEGGHADFAANTPDDVILWQFARQRWEHVSWERVVSGPGLELIWKCLTEQMKQPKCDHVKRQVAENGDLAAAIGEHAVARTCPTCLQAARWLVRLLGAQAGNLALTGFTLGGVYLAGGLTDKLWPIVQEGEFMTAFCNKGRYRDLLLQIPVMASRNSQIALQGAQQAALKLLDPGL